MEQSLFDPPAEKLPVGQPVESKSPPPVASAGYPPPELKAAEERALRLEQLLEAATAREAVSSSERRQLRKQLERSHSAWKQIDEVNDIENPTHLGCYIGFCR